MAGKPACVILHCRMHGKQDLECMGKCKFRISTKDTIIIIMAIVWSLSCRMSMCRASRVFNVVLLNHPFTLFALHANSVITYHNVIYTRQCMNRELLK